MKIDSAKICIDCNEVFDGDEHTDCPRCASTVTVWLDRWISPVRVVLADALGVRSGA